MKKIYYLLCMFFALGIFNACSDDDNDVESLLPVTEIIVPAKVQAGGEMIIAGNGFASDCKILLKNDTQSVELTVSERLSASVSCTIPVTLPIGEYTVVLIQSGEWPLRKITVLEEGAGNTDIPVWALLLPTDPVTAGKEADLKGIGFAKECEIYLQTGEELQKMKITVSNNGVKFNVPGSLSTGVYPVVLKQDGGQWTLGEIKVNAVASPVKTQIDKITEKYTKKDKERVIEYRYTYTGDKISSIEEIKDGNSNKLADFDRSTTEKLMVNIYYYDSASGTYDKTEGNYETYEYSLDENDRITSSLSGDWSYKNGEYLETVGGDYYVYTYDGNHIVKCAINDSYVVEYRMDYSLQQANNSFVDLMGEIFKHYEIEGDEQYYARIAGICGKMPDLLPAKVTLLGDETYPDEIKNITYETDPSDGYISKIIFDDGHTLEVTYK